MKLKTFALFFVCLMLVFSISVAAVSDIKIDVGKDFYVLSRNPEKVYDILGQTKEELRDYCNSQGIVYFAVNEDNTKQISVSCKKTKFSEELRNISFLTESEINEIAAKLIENLDDVRFGIEEKNSQKFIYTEQQMSDSGGEYTYISFLTVADESIYTISFYTAKGIDTEYVWDVFESFKSDAFLNYNDSNEKKGTALTIILSVIAVWMLYTIARDLYKSKTAQSNEE